MEIGDRVIYYTHEASDTTHRTVDALAFVTGIQSDKAIDVVAFPVGGPVRFYTVSLWNPDEDEEFIIGDSYWRPHGEAPPDFSRAYWHHNDPEWQALLVSQRAERDKLTLTKPAPEAIDALRAKQLDERHKLVAKLDKIRPYVAPEAKK